MNQLQHSLLLVEDTLDDETLSLRAIMGSGVACDVSVLRDGGAALNLLLAPSGPVPDLIVLDFHLPIYNGLEILRALRAQDRTAHVPIVILSALDSQEDVEACLNEGANSCVRKPTDPELYTDHVGLIVRYWLTINQSPE